MLKVVGDEAVEDGMDGRSLLDEVAREGARRMLVAALEAEVAAYAEADGVHFNVRPEDTRAARPHLLPLVRADVRFTDGVQVERREKDRRKNAA